MKDETRLTKDGGRRTDDCGPMTADLLPPCRLVALFPCLLVYLSSLAHWHIDLEGD
jgi:hypothetical protein